MPERHSREGLHPRESEASSSTATSSSRPFDVTRTSSDRPTQAMSPGGTIYDVGTPRSLERTEFLNGPAKLTTNQSGENIRRPEHQQLTGNDIRTLTRTGRFFVGHKNWESFANPDITTRDELLQAQAAHRAQVVYNGSKTKGVDGCSRARVKGHETIRKRKRAEDDSNPHSNQ